ncbi:hypothetical protein [Clostridium sp. Ade.TY]|uniref:hypothetical protein n=1 Tax=Clostridium sp. Ade.TY TaxID=1391647 RepID=UPI00040557FA|nr:hypothetical protein [Clostridium sp. Ade.TY]
MSKVLENKSLENRSVGFSIVDIVSEFLIVLGLGFIFIYSWFGFINLEMLMVIYGCLFLGCLIKLISFLYK